MVRFGHSVHCDIVKTPLFFLVTTIFEKIVIVVVVIVIVFIVIEITAGLFAVISIVANAAVHTAAAAATHLNHVSSEAAVAVSLEGGS